jgi:hypothetical protein
MIRMRLIHIEKRLERLMASRTKRRRLRARIRQSAQKFRQKNQTQQTKD